MRVMTALLLGVAGVVLLASLGYCQPPCGTFKCSNQYAPVCGKSKCGICKTFRNECQLWLYNCEHACKYKVCAKGECIDNCKKCKCKKMSIDGKVRNCGTNCKFCRRQQHCRTVCTKEYRPICGCNKHNVCRTFGNPCMFRSHNCVNQGIDEYKFKFLGECVARNGQETDTRRC